MKVIRKINNNAAVAQDRNGREMVVMGRGVGFGVMPYELTDLSRIYRTFYDVDPRYFDALADLPQNVVLASADIVEQAEISLGGELNANLAFTLADHIAFAIQREKKGIILAMPLAYDVKRLYPKESELGIRALEIIRLHTGTSLPDAESVSIALHLINAELEGSNMHTMLTALNVLEELTAIVEQRLGIVLCREGYNYARFAMHLQFLVQRLQAGRPAQDNSENLLEQTAQEYPEIYDCACALVRHLEERYGWQCSRDEILYLMLHIHRVQNREED